VLRRAAAAVLVALCAAPVLLAAAQAIHVTPLVRDGRVFVSFKLADAFDNEEIRAAVHSGLTITFVYDVELRRGASLWIDRTLDAATVSAGVQYDNLARRYHMTLRADGRLEDTQTVDEKLNLFSAGRLEPNIEYYVRVRARTTPRNAAFVWPWQGGDVAGFAKFTFLR
jgi:putative intracellular protease/amidase